LEVVVGNAGIAPVFGRAVSERDSVTMAPDEALAERLGHRFMRPELLRQALTHRSVTSGRGAPAGYERLEFLGDRVLGLVVAQMLFELFASENEGALARRFAALVSGETLGEVARSLDLGRYLVLSRGEEDSGGRRNAGLLADACEAVIAALYLDGGLSAAAAFVRRFWEPLMGIDQRPPQDAKTALQEWAQGVGLPLPIYRTVREEGPAHDPVFEIEVLVEGQPPASASGRSKRVAETAAATLLLGRLKGERRD
jgi:ribonuclease-3